MFAPNLIFSFSFLLFFFFLKKEMSLLIKMMNKQYKEMKCRDCLAELIKLLHSSSNLAKHAEKWEIKNGQAE